MKLQDVLSRITDKQALALWNAVAQWVDNEESRNDGEIDSNAVTLGPVVAAMDAVVAGEWGAARVAMRLLRNGGK